MYRMKDAAEVVDRCSHVRDAGATAVGVLSFGALQTNDYESQAMLACEVPVEVPQSHAVGVLDGEQLMFEGMNKRRLSREWSRDNGLVSVRQLCSKRHRTRFWVSTTHPNVKELRESRIRGGYCVRCRELYEWRRMVPVPVP